MLTWEPWRIDWWATAVQFVGTLFFNISTFAAVRGSTMSIAHQNHRIWMPDVLGSICFLVASRAGMGRGRSPVVELAPAVPSAGGSRR